MSHRALADGRAIEVEARVTSLLGQSAGAYSDTMPGVIEVNSEAQAELLAEVNSESQAEQLSTRIIRDEFEWDSIRRDWDELFASSCCASFSLHFEWLKNWWRIYGKHYCTDGMRIVTVWRGARCIGAIPLYVGRCAVGPIGIRELRMMSTGESEFEETCPDYIDLLCLPGDEAACRDAVWKAINDIAWDRIRLERLPAESALLSGDLSANCRPCRSEVTRAGVCQVADLSQGFEGFLKTRSAATRKNARRIVRDADRDGAVFELATASNSDQFFDDLVRLHQERWTSEGKAGCYAAPRFTEFHRRLVRDWVPSGQATLGRLSHGGQAYGIQYGFLCRSKFYAYQIGLKRTNSGPFHSEGTALTLLFMRALAARGVTAYDFLREGKASYKQSFATHANQLVELKVCRRSFNVFVFRAARLAARGIHKLSRRVTSDGKPTMRNRAEHANPQGPTQNMAD